MAWSRAVERFDRFKFCCKAVSGIAMFGDVMAFIFRERFQHVSGGSRTSFPRRNFRQFDNLTISGIRHFRGFCSRYALSTLQSTHAWALFYSDASKRALITPKKLMLCNFQSTSFAFVLFLEQKRLPKEVRQTQYTFDLFLSLTGKLFCRVAFFVVKNAITL